MLMLMAFVCEQSCQIAETVGTHYKAEHLQRNLGCKQAQDWALKCTISIDDEDTPPPLKLSNTYLAWCN